VLAQRWKDREFRKLAAGKDLLASDEVRAGQEASGYSSAGAEVAQIASGKGVVIHDLEEYA
jgi:hypothetical protein